MDDYYALYWGLGLVTAAILGLIPANIAKRKGYSFGIWWLYGWMLFIFAIIHVSFLKDKNDPREASGTPSAADEIKKYKELLDSGAITKEEYEIKKNQLLGISPEVSRKAETKPEKTIDQSNDYRYKPVVHTKVKNFREIDDSVWDVIKANNGKLNSYTFAKNCPEIENATVVDLMDSLDRLIKTGRCKKNEDGFFEAVY